MLLGISSFGTGNGEIGLRLSPWWSPDVDGVFMLNTASGEIACFGGRLPFYSFTGNHGQTYVKGTSVTLSIALSANVGTLILPLLTSTATPSRVSGPTITRAPSATARAYVVNRFSALSSIGYSQIGKRSVAGRCSAAATKPSRTASAARAYSFDLSGSSNASLGAGGGGGGAVTAGAGAGAGAAGLVGGVTGVAALGSAGGGSTTTASVPSGGVAVRVAEGMTMTGTSRFGPGYGGLVCSVGCSGVPRSTMGAAGALGTLALSWACPDNAVRAVNPSRTSST